MNEKSHYNIYSKSYAWLIIIALLTLVGVLGYLKFEPLAAPDFLGILICIYNFMKDFLHNAFVRKILSSSKLDFLDAIDKANQKKAKREVELAQLNNISEYGSSTEDFSKKQ